VLARLNENDALIYRHIWSPDDNEMHALQAKIDANIEANAKALDAYGKIMIDDRNRPSLENARQIRGQFLREYKIIIAASYSATNAALSKPVSDRASAELMPLSDAYQNAIYECLGDETNSANQSAASIEEVTRSANIGVVIGIVSALVLGSLMASLIIKGTNRVLGHVSSSLSYSNGQVVSAAGQVSASCQTLAEGASEQASSLEETSSSLEELASTTKRNAENAKKANDFARQARQAADKGAADMQTMTTAMDAIKTSSDDIAKIIKTIDEIAFQTNILALNAAVEAARAGEAGMGFAVVADEVRNLAQRSAQAAKETAAKIEGAIGKSTQGVAISKQVAETLNAIVTHIRQVDELAAEVAAASREQTQGITQINTAVGQMDKVTQSNAASAEESAAAAEELNAQAESMRESVGKLLKLVGDTGQGSPAINARASDAKHLLASAPVSKHPAAASRNGERNGDEPTAPVTITTTHRRSEIPMDGEFRDF
jgi:methyl-accepting chemotaxis protein